MKRCAHQLQRAVEQREILRTDFLIKSQENRYITVECQLRRQNLRRITALKERVRIEKEHLCVQLRRQRQRAAQEKEAYSLAIAQIRVRFEHISDFNTNAYFIYVQYTI